MPKQNFNLDKIFYTSSLVSRAKEAFADFDIEITKEGIGIDDEFPQDIFDEFSNYCIALLDEQLV
jgi:hypothetical protein